jgi:hypothetical protein
MVKLHFEVESAKGKSNGFHEDTCGELHADEFFHIQTFSTVSTLGNLVDLLLIAFINALQRTNS